MKQGSPVHFLAGFFEAIAPDSQRMRRKTERRGILGMSHAAEVHRLNMHAPERPKSNRTTVRTHAVAIARRPLTPLRLPLFVLTFYAFPAEFPQVFRTLAWAQQMARPRHQRCRRKTAPAAIVLRVQSASIPGRNMSVPERIVGPCLVTARRHRSSSTAAENPKWNENKLSERRAGFGRLPRRRMTAR